MSRQREILQKQKETLSGLLKSKFNQDFVLDSGIFAAVFYFCNTSMMLSVMYVYLHTANSIALVDYPVSLIALLLARKGTRKQDFAKQLFKTMYVPSIVP